MNLINALKTGEIDYAALDVTDPEPLPANHPLPTISTSEEPASTP